MFPKIVISESHNSSQSNRRAKRKTYEVAPCERAFGGAFGVPVGIHGEEPIDFPFDFSDLRFFENLVIFALRVKISYPETNGYGHPSPRGEDNHLKRKKKKR
jgi:hypothetical protein